MKLTADAVLALIGCLIAALVPLPKRAEGARLGFFAALIVLLLADSSRKRAQARDRDLVPLMVANSSTSNPTADRADRLRRAGRLLDSASQASASAQWRRFEHLVRSRDAGVKSAA